MQAKCVDFALTILYIILISMFLGWGLFHRKRERNQTSRMNQLSDIKDSGEVIRKKDENLPAQVPPFSYLFLLSGFCRFFFALI
jgi:Niemann-Pick C1 protein